MTTETITTAFTEENYPVGTTIIWRNTGHDHWRGGEIQQWHDSGNSQRYAETPYWYVRPEHISDHATVPSLAEFSVGDRVTVTRNQDYPDNPQGTITLIIGGRLLLRPDGADDNSRDFDVQYWQVDKVEDDLRPGAYVRWGDENSWRGGMVERVEGDIVYLAHSSTPREGLTVIPVPEPGQRITVWIEPDNEVEQTVDRIEGDLVYTTEGGGYFVWRCTILAEEDPHAFTEANYPVGTHLAWYYTNTNQWCGGQITSWYGVEASTGTWLVSQSVSNQHVKISAPEDYSVGDRVRVVRSNSRGDRRDGVVTSRVGELVMIETPDGDQFSVSYWVLDKDVIEAAPEPTQEQAQEWPALANRSCVVYQDQRERWTVARVYGDHEAGQDVINTGNGAISRSTTPSMKPWVPVTPGMEVQTHDGQATGVVSQRGPITDSPYAYIEVTDENGRGSAFDHWMLAPREFTPEEQAKRDLAQAAIEAEAALKKAQHDIRVLAWQMKASQGYCSELENFLGNVGLGEEPPLKAAVTATWNLTFDLADGDHGRQLSFRIPNLEAKFREFLETVDFEEFEQIEEVESTVTVDSLTISLDD